MTKVHYKRPHEIYPTKDMILEERMIALISQAAEHFGSKGVMMKIAKSLVDLAFALFCHCLYPDRVKPGGDSLKLAVADLEISRAYLIARFFPDKDTLELAVQLRQDALEKAINAEADIRRYEVKVKEADIMKNSGKNEATR